MTHPDDGALLRHLDLESSEYEADQLKTHLGACVSCNQRLAEIRNTMSLVANVLSRTDYSVRPRRKIRLPRYVALAASILLATVCITPLRAWMVERARHVLNGDDPVVVSSPQSELAADSLGPATGSISFIPANDVFVLEFTSRQETGSVTVTIGDGEMATATISGESLDETLLVLPDRLRLVNSTASMTTYAVVLPASVERVDVIIAAEDTVVLRPSDTRRSWTIPVHM